MNAQRLGFLDRRQRGQTLILFTLLFTVLIGFLALAIDLGFLFGQRRWDQDGADASAMALGHIIAGSISPASDDTLFINYTDCNLYLGARQYGGLNQPASCSNGMSTTPTGTNQNAGVDSMNKVAVVVEYSNGSSVSDTWCYSPASIAALPTGTQSPRSGESSCTLSNTSYPPVPGSHPYKVRVTVSSVTTSSFAQVLVSSGNLGPSPQPSNQSVPACVRPGGAKGMLACAQAVVTISGDIKSNPVAAQLPVVTSNCIEGVVGQLYPLWSSNPNECQSDPNTNPWKSFIDLTSETIWCNSYQYQDILPDNLVDGQTRTSYGVGNCQVEPDPGGSEHDWNRKKFSPDPNYPGQDSPSNDLTYWSSQGFGGTIWASEDASDPGNFVPTYCDRNSGISNGSSCGDLGNNIAVGFYCSQNNVGVDGDSCSLNPSAPGHPATFFFRKSSRDSDCTLPGGGSVPAGVHCRMAGIPTWGNPQWSKPGGWKTNNGSGGPDRVQLKRVVSMRLFCQEDGNGNCTQAPSSLPGVSGGNSSVFGFFVSDDFQSCPPGDTCGGPLSITINVPTLSQ